jgi:hypothetical protein
MTDWLPLLTQYAAQVPYYVVWLVGIILCAARWQRHPTVSLLALLGFGLLLVQSLVGTFLFYWVVRQQSDAGWTSQQLSSYLTALNLARTAVSSVAWVLILVALFGWRYRPVQLVSVAEEPERLGPPGTAIRERRPMP